MQRRAALAGMATGALAFKPQIATMLPMLFALRRDWRALGVAAVVAGLLTGSAVLILGRDTVPAFLSSTSVVAEFMASGTFPLHRMTSVYAFALSLGHAGAAGPGASRPRRPLCRDRRPGDGPSAEAEARRPALHRTPEPQPA